MTEDQGKSFLEDENLELNKKVEADALAIEEAMKLEEAKRLAEAEEEDKKMYAEVESPLTGMTLNEFTHDHSPETDSPTPVKVRKNNLGTTESYTIWKCPRCKSNCVREQLGWKCSNEECLYGKPKPLAEAPEEVTRYKTHIPELGVAVQNLVFTKLPNGKYKIKDGQEKLIFSKALKKLQDIPWKKLTVDQISFLLSNDPRLESI